MSTPRPARASTKTPVQPGVYRARPGQTAQQIYRAVIDHLRAQSNIPTSPSVMHWSMTPNQL